jgi:hypothetical protein
MIITKYITALITLIIILFIYCHVSRLKTLNNDLQILQVCDPEPDMIYELFDKHQAIVFQRELYFWKAFNTLVGENLNDIKAAITINTDINYTEFIKNNIEIYNLPLSYDWNIDIRNINLNEQSAICFIRQNNYMQLFGCVSGEMRVIIATPDQHKLLEPFVNMVSTVDATQILNKEPIELNYIEIIVRQGNMIYIPWNWLYFIYKGNGKDNDSLQHDECVMIDCENKSALSYI